MVGLRPEKVAGLGLESVAPFIGIRTINADGLMFVAIEKWQKQYELTDTDARVSLLFLLYSKSGKKLWSWRQV